jgi:hypothetical protein
MFVSVLAALGLMSAAALSAPTPQPPDRAIEAQCRQFFPHGCSEAMGRWLPNLGSSNTWWDRATRVDQRDRFTDKEQIARWPLGDDGPRDGTFFVFGTAGPPKGKAVYDSLHRIAFYEVGCCSWRDVVAAAGVPPPPMHVASRDLRRLSTLRGVRLGESVADVVKIYGNADPLPVPGHPDVRLLAYTTWPTRRAMLHTTAQCGQEQQFFFRDGRLVLIRLGSGC